MFDGTTIPIINWTPDYTGYHNTVNISCPHAVRDGGLWAASSRNTTSPATRIFMELAPSFFLYPRQQQEAADRSGPAPTSIGNAQD